MIPVIRAAAQKYDIDPDVAVRVAQSEDLNKFIGDNGTSFGAMQLHIGGGVGDDFRRDTSLDPSDPKNEPATIDYAMRKAARNGWGAWHKRRLRRSRRGHEFWSAWRGGSARYQPRVDPRI